MELLRLVDELQHRISEPSAGTAGALHDLKRHISSSLYMYRLLTREMKFARCSSTGRKGVSELEEVWCLQMHTNLWKEAPC